MNQALLSSLTPEWETPKAFFDMLDREFHFTLDPASTHENAKCSKHYTEAEDGLKMDWSGETVFCNPPYGRELPKWIKKCFESAGGGYYRCYAHTSANRHESISRLYLGESRNQVHTRSVEIRSIQEFSAFPVNGCRIWTGHKARRENFQM